MRYFCLANGVSQLAKITSKGRFLKELTEGHHQEWSLRLNLTQHGKSHQARTLEGLTD